MNRNFKLRSYGYIALENKIWFPNLYFNGLVEIDKLTGKIDHIYRFPGYNVRTSFLYSTVCQVDDELILIPNKSSKIAVFHMKTKEISYYELDEKKIGKDQPYFRNAYTYNNVVYMFPSKARFIVKFDVILHTIHYIALDIQEDESRQVHFRQEFEVVGNKVYLRFAEKNSIYIFDLESEKGKTIWLEAGHGYSTINYVNDSFWLAAWETLEFYNWNEKSGKVKVYNCFPAAIQKGKYTFAYAGVIESQIIYFPQQCNMIVSLNILTGEIKCIKEVSSWNEEQLITFYGKKEVNGINVMLSGENNILNFQYSNNNYLIRPYFELNKEFNDFMIKTYMIDEQGYYFFEPYLDLEGFLKMVKNDDNLTVDRNTNFGEKIFRNLRG